MHHSRDHIPPELAAAVAQVFGAPGAPAFGQLATAGTAGPEIRTVQFRHDVGRGTLLFGSHAGSRKLAGLGGLARAAACYYDAARDMQWQWTFTAEVIRAGAPGAAEELRHRAWQEEEEALRRLSGASSAAARSPTKGRTARRSPRSLRSSPWSSACPTPGSCSRSIARTTGAGAGSPSRARPAGAWESRELPLLYTPASRPITK